jgi:hypothetical protein
MRKRAAFYSFYPPLTLCLLLSGGQPRRGMPYGRKRRRPDNGLVRPELRAAKVFFPSP